MGPSVNYKEASLLGRCLPAMLGEQMLSLCDLRKGFSSACRIEQGPNCSSLPSSSGPGIPVQGPVCTTLPEALQRILALSFKSKEHRKVQEPKMTGKDFAGTKVEGKKEFLNNTV